MAQGVHSDITRMKSCRSKRRNFQKGDIVLLKADYNRNNRPIARIIETSPDKHGKLNPIKLRLGDVVCAEQRKSRCRITKIVLLVESDFPTESDENIGKFPDNFGGAR